jgi:nicotinate-nucleotide adenylyltransferase
MAIIKTGLFFGSFNPIHIGHLAIANYMVEFTDMDEIWFVVSPQNPFKKKKTLLPDQLRLEMVELAIKGDPRFSASDVEFRMPTPSYTIDTLVHLKEKHGTRNFGLIIGSDNLQYFDKWKNYQMIENQFKRYIYPRPGTNPEDYKELKNSTVVQAPLIEISSSFIRDALKGGKKIDWFLPKGIYAFIEKLNLYG